MVLKVVPWLGGFWKWCQLSSSLSLPLICVCLLPSPVLIVVPWLGGGRLGCSCGCVVDFGFQALAALFSGNPCIATLACHMPSREVKLCGQPPPVDVLREVNAFAPSVVLRAATLVHTLAGWKCCGIWRSCAVPCCGISTSCGFPDNS